jgi:CHAT domain-containing protein
VINLDIGFTDGAEPIRIGDLRASGATGGQVTIDLATGDLELDTGNPSGLTIDVRGLNGVGGSVDLNAPSNIAVDTIQATGTAGGGRVAIASDVGGYTGDTINTSATTSGVGGSITINVGFGIELLGDLIADGITRGGTITLNSLGAIEAQRLSAQASSSGGGSGGSVRLANQTDITLGSINVQGGANGTGGSVAIDSSTLQLFGIFTDRQGQNASISAAGGAGPGSIQIDNAAITNGVPFTIGSVNNGNGSAGVLTTGGDTLPNGTIVAEPLLLDTIRINQSTPTPTPSPEPSPTPSPEPTPTPSPEPSPTPSPEPTPTPSPEPSPEPSPTPSPEPTPSPSPSPGPRTDREDQQIAIDLAPSKPGNTPPPNNIQASDRFTPLRRSQIDQFLDAGQVYKALALLDAEMSNEFIQYLRLRDVNIDGSSSSGNAEDNISIEAIQLAQAELLTAQNATGTVPAMVYMFADTDRLSIIVVPSEGQPIYHSVAVDRDTLIAATNDLQNSLINARLRRTNSHLIPARQLYDWLIAPMRDDLVRLGIDNLIFALDSGFRGLPIAALHDGDRYLVEDFAIGLIPSVSLVDFTPKNLRDAPVLAMGASEFTDLSALPAVPFEVEFISTLSSGRSFLNDEFTLKNVIDQRDTYPAPILHLATHAEFSAGELSNSYIQLWDRKLSLDRIRELNLNDPAVEMMVLSACRTAIGNEDAELGFAGMAVQSGVKSVVASLWYVSDAGTLSLMSQFYEAIHSAPTRAFALREAQLAMLRGEVVVQDGQLVTSRGSISVPDNLNLGTSDFSNPYYWAAFTMIGSPW